MREIEDPSRHQGYLAGQNQYYWDQPATPTASHDVVDSPNLWLDQAVWRISQQLNDHLEQQGPRLLINPSYDLQAIIYDFDGSSGRKLDELEQKLLDKHRELQDKHSRISDSLGWRLRELKGDWDRVTEREILAAEWYWQHTNNLGNLAKFHQTRLELGKLDLVSAGIFDINKVFDTQQEMIVRVAQDECLAAINEIYAQEMWGCYECWQEIAGHNPENEARQSAAIRLRDLQSMQNQADANRIAAFSNQHAHFRTVVQQLGELGPARGWSIEPAGFANDWLFQTGEQISRWATEANEAWRRTRHEIHLTAPINT